MNVGASEDVTPKENFYNQLTKENLVINRRLIQDEYPLGSLLLNTQFFDVLKNAVPSFSPNITYYIMFVRLELRTSIKECCKCLQYGIFS